MSKEPIKFKFTLEEHIEKINEYKEAVLDCQHELKKYKFIYEKETNIDEKRKILQKATAVKNEIEQYNIAIKQLRISQLQFSLEDLEERIELYYEELEERGPFRDKSKYLGAIFILEEIRARKIGTTMNNYEPFDLENLRGDYRNRLRRLQKNAGLQETALSQFYKKSISIIKNYINKKIVKNKMDQIYNSALKNNIAGVTEGLRLYPYCFDFSDLIQNTKLKNYNLKLASEIKKNRYYRVSELLNEYRKPKSERTFSLKLKKINSAIKKQDLKKLKEYIEKHGKNMLHYYDESGFTPMHYAAKIGDPDIFDYLLEMDGNSFAAALESQNRITPLHMLVLYKNNACLDLAFAKLEKNKKLEKIKLAKDIAGLNPFHYAIVYQNQIAFDKLVRLKNIKNSRDNSENTPLHYAAHYDQNGYMIKALLKNKLVSKNVSVENHAGEMPLHVAALYNKNPDCTQLILDKMSKKDINRKSGYGQTACQIAEKSGRKGNATRIKKALMRPESDKENNENNNIQIRPILRRKAYFIPQSTPQHKLNGLKN